MVTPSDLAVETLITGKSLIANIGDTLKVLDLCLDPIDPYHLAAILDLKRGWMGINNELKK